MSGENDTNHDESTSDNESHTSDSLPYDTSGTNDNISTPPYLSLSSAPTDIIISSPPSLSSISFPISLSSSTSSSLQLQSTLLYHFIDKNLSLLLDIGYLFKSPFILSTMIRKKRKKSPFTLSTEIWKTRKKFISCQIYSRRIFALLGPDSWRLAWFIWNLLGIAWNCLESFGICFFAWNS